MDQQNSRPPLGPWLWLFIVTRIIGVIMNAGFVLFLMLWALPAVASLEEGAYAGDVLVDVLLPVAEIVATIVGLVLVLRRSPSVRRYWVIYLSLYSLVQFWQVFVSLEPGGPVIFFAVGLGWLAYWLWAPRARQLPLEGAWVRPVVS
jgi:hypothetical protein